jgi:CheY-like chemotaxis protein
MEALQLGDGFSPPLILVVEDDPLLRSYLADELRDSGFRVVQAANADEALSYMHAHSDVSLVMTDVQMPGSLDGLEMAAKLRDAYPDMPVIITSGNAHPDAARGLGTFIAKPYTFLAVSALVRKMLCIEPEDESDHE